MNGVHDMGGMHGFGPVLAEANRHPGRAEWEHRADAILRAMLAGGLANIDEARHAIERLPPADYLAASYYERWLQAFERLLVEKGVVTADAVAGRMARLRDRPTAPPPPPPVPPRPAATGWGASPPPSNPRLAASAAGHAFRRGCRCGAAGRER
jgi:nitrile hydratase